jgi:hypothetical protein
MFEASRVPFSIRLLSQVESPHYQTEAEAQNDPVVRKFFSLTL